MGAVLLAGACGTGDDAATGTGPATAASDGPSTTAPPDEEPIAALGDCAVLVEAPAGSGGPLAEEEVPCDEPHDFEVVGVVEVDAPRGAPYPGVGTGEDDQVGAVQRQVLADCRSRFEDYAGAGADEVGVVVLARYPSEAEWDDGKRSVRCIATQGLGTAPGEGVEKKTGSVRAG